MAGHNPSQTGVNALVPGHPRLRSYRNRKTWMPGTRPGMTKLPTNPVEPIETLRGAEKQIVLLSCARAFRQNLAGVPEHRIAVRTLVDREVALEHAARRAERRDARFDVRLPGIGERLRGRGVGELLEAEAADAHAEPAKFHGNVRAFCEGFDRLLPARENFLVPVGVNA